MFDQLPIVLTTRDYALIEALHRQSGEPFAGAGELARRKLDAATVVFPADVPRDVVTLNSRVRFHVGNGRSQDRLIVGGPSEVIYGITLQLVSPRGLAIIGQAAGQKVPALRKDGSIETITIEAVLFQPERGRRPTLVHDGDQLQERNRTPAFLSDDPGPSAA